MTALEEEMDKVLPQHHYAIDPSKTVTVEHHELTLIERLALLDENVSKIEALRDKARPAEEKFRDMEVKYGRTGKFPAYPVHGVAVDYEHRFPHTDERLGKYKNLLPPENEFMDLVQVTSDINNPSFRSSFIQEPNKFPDVDLNFEKSGVLYENDDAAGGVDLTQ
jgi:hypothetical protein